MNKVIEMYREVFPHTGLGDWFYAFCGLLLHVIVKIQSVSFHHFKWRRFLEDFLPVWFYSLIAIVILVGVLPQVMPDYNLLDSALIGYSSSSIFKQLLKSKTPNLSKP